MQLAAWEREKEKLCFEVEKKYNDLGERTPLIILSELDFPSFINEFLVERAKGIFRKERPVRIVISDNFNFSDPQFKKNLVRLREQIIQQVLFSKKDIGNIVEKAIEHQFNAIVYPFRYIRDKVKMDKKQNDRVILPVENYLSLVPQELALIKPLREKLTPEILASDSKYDKLTRDIKRKVYVDDIHASLKSDIKQMLSFYEAILNVKKDHISGRIALSMVKDRGLKGLANALKPQAEKMWQIDELLDFFKSIKNSGSSTLENATISSDSTNNRINPTTNSDANDRGSATKRPKPRLYFTETTEFDPTASEIIRREQIEYQPPGPYPSIHSMMSEKLKNTFVKKIFSKRRKDFNVFFDTIETQKSWKGAKQVLDTELQKRSISPYSKEAVKMSDIIFARYFSSER